MTDVTLHGEPVSAPVRSFGKRAVSTALYALVAALALVTPLLVFLPAVLLHCGIRNGKRAAWIVMIVATALALLLVIPGASSSQSTPAQANSGYAALYGAVLAIGLPALLVLPMVERGERFGRVLMFALLLATAGMFATEGIMRATASYSPYAEQLAMSRALGVNVVDGYQQKGAPADSVRMLRKWINLGIYVQPASILAFITLIFVISMMLVGRLRAWRQLVAARALPAPAPYLFRNLQWPEWLLFAFVLGGISPLTSGLVQHIGANVLAIVCFLYFLQGLAIFRAFLAAAGGGLVVLAWGTLCLLMVTGLGGVMLAIAGLFDSFFDFRHFNRKDHSDESHSH